MSPSGQMLESQRLQSKEGRRGAGAAMLGLAEVKPHTSDMGQRGTLQPVAA